MNAWPAKQQHHIPQEQKAVGIPETSTLFAVCKQLWAVKRALERKTKISVSSLAGNSHYETSGMFSDPRVLWYPHPRAALP